MTGPPAPADDLAARLTTLTVLDERRLRRRLRSAERIPDQVKRARALADIEQAVGTAQARIDRRRGSVPALRFPPELPVSERVDDLAAAIEANQVVIVAGETGSGKSTQLPKICLQLGRGVRGTIGHTQPRRIAARALAERIAEETGTEVGGAVGYAIRFGDHTGPNTLVKLMTDGILLNEIVRDRMLWAYDTIIIDEAHERSLNIDFLLGYLRQLLPRRPDLKLIITSATIDPQRFSRHFHDAPIVEVSGRTYPVEIRYRPFGVDEDDETDDPDAEPPRASRPAGPGRTTGAARAREEAVDQAQAICDAVDELTAAGDGDILVFLSGEREITDTAEVLRGYLASRPPSRGGGGRTEVLPLYGRLSAADQHKVFSPHQGRRIVLATNVAETSLTVPGIRYVIDPGTARISRYSPRSKVQRLPIEPISQASAGQRAGRCGRVADGICIRLYSEEDFAGRPEYTDPEIARTSLASVILQMASLDLGDIEDFPFLDPPDRRQITDGVTVLTELGALDAAADRPRLTPTGRSMAALPLDPRLARILIEGSKLGCLRDMLIIVAALAIVDVREYPLEERDKATAAHSRFVDPSSDFSALLGLWVYLEDQAKSLSGNAFRKMCRREYLNYLRIREWQDLHAQLRQICRGLGMEHDAAARTGNAPSSTDNGRRPADESDAAAPARTVVAQASGVKRSAVDGAGKAGQGARGSLAVEVDSEKVHTALLAGLLSHIGQRSEASRDYQGTRGITFQIWPGSALARTGPQLVMAAELVETSRLWGRICARIDPAWVERVGGELLRRSYSEPRWNAKRASVEATEKVLLLGVTLFAARTVQFDRIDPELSREIFIRHALVERDWTTRHRFFADNQRALDDVAAWEERTRRRDIVVDDETLYALYDARIPADVTSGRHFDSWWKKASRSTPELMTFTTEMLIAAGSERFDAAAFPDRFSSGGVDLELGYVFDPGRRDDGVTVTIPLAVLARVDPAAFEQQIPGLRSDLAVALIRSLPKTLRRNFVPVPDFATAALARIRQRAGAGDQASLPAQLAAELTALTGVVVRPQDFDLAKVPDHLRMTFTVVDDAGKAVGAGKDLGTLQQALRSDTRQAVAKASGTKERTGLTTYPAEGVARTVTSTVAGQQVTGYPALVDEGGTVGLQVFTSPADQARAMRAGIRRLLVLGSTVSLAQLRQSLTHDQQLTLAATPYGSIGELVADATAAAIDALLDWAGGPAWTAADFTAVAAKIQPNLKKAVRDVVVAAEQTLRAARAAAGAIDHLAAGPAAAALADLIADMRGQLTRSLAPGFITRTGAAGLPDLTRQLQALTVRAQRVTDAPARDREHLAEITAVAAEVESVVAALPAERRDDADVRAVRRLVDELRVALFAQPMRTAVPVSVKRIRQAAAALRA
jgi:ATP-dependent helicase HrpA